VRVNVANRIILSTSLPLLALLFLTPSVEAQNESRSAHDQRTPIVISLNVPTYPPVGISAELEGEAKIAVRVEKGKVTNATVVSATRQFFGSAAAKDVQSWKFEKAYTGRFEVVFTYVLESERTAEIENPHIEMELPARVVVKAKKMKPVRLGPN
jgi:outer membrane biosynthesis protein TonB